MNKNFQALIIEFIFLALMVFNVVYYWKNNLYSTIIAIVLVIMAFLLFHKKEDLVFFWLGALFGTIAEIVCVYYGVWTYSNPVVLGIPLWLPILWGFAWLFARRIRDTILNLEHLEIHYIHHQDLPPRLLIFFYDIILFGLAVFFTAILWKNNILVFIILLILLWMSAHHFHKKEDVLFIVLAGIIGPATEIVCISTGAWFYSNPTILGIPFWLPVAYALLGLVVKRTATSVVNFVFKN